MKTCSIVPIRRGEMTETQQEREFAMPYDFDQLVSPPERFSMVRAVIRRVKEMGSTFAVAAGRNFKKFIFGFPIGDLLMIMGSLLMLGVGFVDYVVISAQTFGVSFLNYITLDRFTVITIVLMYAVIMIIFSLRLSLMEEIQANLISENAENVSQLTAKNKTLLHFINNNNPVQREIWLNEKLQSNEIVPTHHDIFCNGCTRMTPKKSIRGVRYHCLRCPDVDLCEKCKKKGIHNKHPMIGISLSY